MDVFITVDSAPYTSKAILVLCLLLILLPLADAMQSSQTEIPWLGQDTFMLYNCYQYDFKSLKCQARSGHSDRFRPAIYFKKCLNPKIKQSEISDIFNA